MSTTGAFAALAAGLPMLALQLLEQALRLLQRALWLLQLDCALSPPAAYHTF